MSIVFKKYSLHTFSQLVAKNANKLKIRHTALLRLRLTHGIYAFFGIYEDGCIPRSELNKGE
jgi:hypothetical protein